MASPLRSFAVWCVWGICVDTDGLDFADVGNARALKLRFFGPLRWSSGRGWGRCPCGDFGGLSEACGVDLGDVGFGGVGAARTLWLRYCGPLRFGVCGGSVSI